jgi:filamentous hemagglutinin
MKPFIPEARVLHIFRDAPGHLSDTPENRRLLIETASDPQNLTGRDWYGNLWYTRQMSVERQVWVQVRGEEICNGGLNQPPRVWSPLTGFSQAGHPPEVEDDDA